MSETGRGSPRRWGDQEFESGLLQRGVRCEPDFRGESHPSRRTEWRSRPGSTMFAARTGGRSRPLEQLAAVADRHNADLPEIPHIPVLLEMRHGDRQERDGLLVRVIREDRAHQPLGDLGKDHGRGDWRVERYRSRG
jgi:hypothetical protein